ncbi:endonuclease domain-containing protein [Enterovirga sp. CN4-39]|uniref:endonuclease domain-containing protein n=1 Tax=Enterovirga sp. CN4-39 TaxID=3400910 RepID=UPI003BFCDE89
MDAPRATIARAKKLRRALTPPEARLWVALRPRPGDLKFRRQHPIGPFVLDFYCAARRLAIEVDGAAHDFGDNPARDIRRDAWLAGCGIRVLRIAAEEVRVNLEGVVETILAAAAECSGGPLHRPAAGPLPPAGEETPPPRISSPSGGGGRREAPDGEGVLS